LEGNSYEYHGFVYIPKDNVQFEQCLKSNKVDENGMQWIHTSADIDAKNNLNAFSEFDESINKYGAAKKAIRLLQNVVILAASGYHKRLDQHLKPLQRKRITLHHFNTLLRLYDQVRSSTRTN